MAQAVWNGEVIAESDDTILVEGNHYFPREAVKDEFLAESDHTSVCGWKGTARYFHVKAGGELNENAAWYYPDPLDSAKALRGRVAFWRGVKVTGEPSRSMEAGQCAI